MNGVFKAEVDINTFFMNCESAHFLDLILIFADTLRKEEKLKFNQEINNAFHVHELPFEIIEDELIIIKSPFFKGVVKEAIDLLNEAGFENAKKEFLSAQGFYKRKEYEDAIRTAHNALDSTMQYIIFSDLYIDDRPTELKTGIFINILKRYGYFKTYQNKMADHIGCLFETPTILRNNIKGAGHCKGPEPDENNKDFSQLALNMSASMILFLVGRFNEIALKDGDIPF